MTGLLEHIRSQPLLQSLCPTLRGLLNIWGPSRQMFGLLQEHKQLVFIHLAHSCHSEKDQEGEGEHKRRKPVPLQDRDLLGPKTKDGGIVG